MTEAETQQGISTGVLGGISRFADGNTDIEVGPGQGAVERVPPTESERVGSIPRIECHRHIRSQSIWYIAINEKDKDGTGLFTSYTIFICTYLRRLWEWRKKEDSWDSRGNIVVPYFKGQKTCVLRRSRCQMNCDLSLEVLDTLGSDTGHFRIASRHISVTWGVVGFCEV